jgi:aminomethyltransferase
LLRTNLCAARFRKSCYFDATVRWGVQSFVPYNHTLLPIGFRTPEEEYASLRSDVCLWDVAAERQIELVGPDALQLAEMLTPRSIGGMKIGECRYVLITDEEANVLNDPLILRLAEDRFWLSIADSDLLLWIKGLAKGLGLSVRVFEASVSPLAVQGPRSTALLRELFGEWVDELKFFHFRPTELDGIPLLLARSGWSPERGYEIFLMDEARGDEVWERMMQAGQKYSIQPGVPNQIRRIEGGLLSYGSDITHGHNALEVGLPQKWVSPDKAADFLGKGALQRLLAEGGPRRQIVGLELLNRGQDPDIAPLICPWKVWIPAAAPAACGGGDMSVGKVTSTCFSPAMDAHIAIATLAVEIAVPGSEVIMETPDGLQRRAVVRKLPFLPREP